MVWLFVGFVIFLFVTNYNLYRDGQNSGLSGLMASHSIYTQWRGFDYTDYSEKTWVNWISFIEKKSTA